jgi:predicted esterase
VIAPKWTVAGQTEYGFSAREHDAVLSSLRDACRRFSIDTDHVYLHGHSIGGTAAWDLGLAHPDLWAGVMPFVATTGKYISRYADNAKYVPLYFVGGELDGDRMTTNAPDLNRYMIRPNYNVTVVEYLGRGHEHFHEEIQRLFDWMGKGAQKRNFFPTEFKARTMRSWDNYFWWMELDDLLESTVVDPVHWPKSGVRPSINEGKIIRNVTANTQTVHIAGTGARRVTLWLAPELVDFSRRITVQVRGRTVVNSVSPDVQVLLEDVRTRGDRQHPFWARVKVQTGR